MSDASTKREHVAPARRDWTLLKRRETPIRHYLCLQALRGLAALAVVVYHERDLFADYAFRPMLEKFYLGVDVFFIISGFVIMLSTEKRENANVGSFVIRRLFRIVPLAWLITLLIALIYHVDLLRLTCSLLFYPEIAPTTYLINPTQWTISFELMFYALFAVALCVSHRYRGEVCVLIVTVLATMNVFNILHARSFVLTDHVYLLEFAAGVLAGKALLRTAGPQASSMGLYNLGPLALAALGSALLAKFLLTGDDVFFGGAAFLFILSILVFEKNWDIYVPRLLIFLGEISYAVYISQHFVFSFVDARLFWTPLSRTWIYAHTENVSRFLLILVVLLVFSIAVHFWVEQPGIRLGQRLANRWVPRRAIQTPGAAHE